MAKKTQKTGLSASGKVAILLVAFGIPCLFFASSWGLQRLYEVAPMALVAVMVLIATAYTAYTAGLMYTFYQATPPVLRFIPCICEVSLMDIKYHTACYIAYAVSLIFLGATQLPYSIVGILGVDFATHAPFYFLVLGLVALLVVQIIKGIGLTACIKDISNDWYKQTHADVGALTKFAPLTFIPFVRVMALYALNKPLSTMVTFMGRTVDDDNGEAEFLEEDEES